MSVAALRGVVAANTVPPLVRKATPPRPGPKELLNTIGKYIPTDVTTGYIAVAGGMATVENLDRDVRFVVAIVASVAAMFVMWVAGHRAASEAANAKGQPSPNPWGTLRGGWYEVTTAGLALFVWATAMPGSWLDFEENAVWASTALVTVASLAIGGVAVLLNRTA